MSDKKLCLDLFAGNKRATRSEVREHAPEYADGGEVSDILTGAQEDNE